MRGWPVLFLMFLPASAAERAAYDSNGRVIALLPDAEDVAVSSNVVAVLPSGRRVRSRRASRALVPPVPSARAPPWRGRRHSNCRMAAGDGWI